MHPRRLSWLADPCRPAPRRGEPRLVCPRSSAAARQPSGRGRSDRIGIGRLACGINARRVARHRNTRFPIVYGWTEPHAAAGHAVIISSSEGRLRDGLSAAGRPNVVATQWTKDTRRYEPACGAAFEPYGPVELGFVTAIVSQAALDSLFFRSRLPLTEYGSRVALSSRLSVAHGPSQFVRLLLNTSLAARPSSDVGERIQNKGHCGVIAFDIGNSGQLLQFANCVLSLDQHRQTRFWHREAGGLLFARLELPKIEVCAVTGPRRTVGGRYSYWPDERAEASEIVDRFARDLHFVGCWHTHPEDNASPSHIDIRNTSDCVKRSHRSFNGFIMVIVGRSPIPEGLFVWSAITPLCTNYSDQPELLRPIRF